MARPRFTCHALQRPREFRFRSLFSSCSFHYDFVDVHRWRDLDCRDYLLHLSLPYIYTRDDTESFQCLAADVDACSLIPIGNLPIDYETSTSHTMTLTFTSVSADSTVLSRLEDLCTALQTVDPSQWLSKYSVTIEEVDRELDDADLASKADVRLNRSLETVGASVNDEQAPSAPDYADVRQKFLAHMGTTAIQEKVKSKSKTSYAFGRLTHDLLMAKIGLSVDQAEEIAEALIGVHPYPFFPQEAMQLLARYIIARDDPKGADEMTAVLKEIQLALPQAASAADDV